jgi:predicted RND superfamily exporter protein
MIPWRGDMVQGIIRRYSVFITRHPFAVVAIMLLVTAFAIHLAGTITTKTTESRDFLPEDVESINTLFLVEDEFGSINDLYFIIQTEPEHAGSNEIRDVRKPEVMRYMDNIAELAVHTEGVMEVTGPSSVLRNINGGRLPLSYREIQDLTSKNGLFDRYLSRDYTTALVIIHTADDADLNTLEVELNKILKNVERPAGISAQLGGRILEQKVVEKSIRPDMRKTSFYSLLGIIAIVLLIFRSVRYGFIPLTTIIFGSIWAMGYVGLVGMGLSSATSGVLSMIMGIGIDFGIQVVTRYRFERVSRTPAEAMEISLNNVILPMTTTTLSALIGFQALKLGKLTFMEEMGVIMSYGVAASMLAAITIVPAIIIILDTVDLRELYNKILIDLR